MKKILFMILICSLLISGCTESDSNKKVEAGDYVSVNYTGTLDNGTIFDTSREEVAIREGIYKSDRNYEPLSFTAGAGQVIKGFDDAVIGMEVGDMKTVTIPPEKAYGAYCPELLVSLPVEQFHSANITPIIGQKVTTQNQVGVVVGISDKNVTVDCNTKLAGENLTFTIELVSIGGTSSVSAKAVSDLIIDTELSDSEINDLAYMREEEKLARDVYLYLYEQWDLPIFNNIAMSEQQHTDAVEALLIKYDVEDPAVTTAQGEFANPELQKLYDDLIEMGSKSRTDALEVGVLIEETDIADLNAAINNTTHADIEIVYSSLLSGSKNHLNAFNKQLGN